MHVVVCYKQTYVPEKKIINYFFLPILCGSPGSRQWVHMTADKRLHCNLHTGQIVARVKCKNNFQTQTVTGVKTVQTKASN